MITDTSPISFFILRIFFLFFFDLTFAEFIVTKNSNANRSKQLPIIPSKVDFEEMKLTNETVLEINITTEMVSNNLRLEFIISYPSRLILQ